MDRKRALTKGLCVSLALACAIAGQTPAYADVKCFSDGSYARTPDVSKEDAEAYCAAQWNLGSEEDFSQPIVLTPQTTENYQQPQGQGEAQSVPAPAPIALMIGGLAFLGRIRKQRLSQQGQPATPRK